MHLRLNLGFLKPHKNPHFSAMSLFKTQNAVQIPRKSFSFVRIFTRTLSAQTSLNNDNDSKSKKSLCVLYEEAVGLREKSQSEIESESESSDDLKKGLKELENEVRNLKENSKNQQNLILKTQKKDNVNGWRSFKTEKKENVKGWPSLKTEKKENVKSWGLYSLFANNMIRENEARKAKREKEVSVLKELSPEMEMLVSHLYKEGYFEKANFLPSDGKELDLSLFNDSYSRDFLKFAAEKFGKSHPEIAKWLSGSDLKKVAQFGCPSLSRKGVLPAKRLRNYFKIQEYAVCQKCVLKDSCSFANQSIPQYEIKVLNFCDVMRVITLYALVLVPPQLVVPDEVKASVSRMLREIVNLSQTT